MNVDGHGIIDFFELAIVVDVDIAVVVADAVIVAVAVVLVLFAVGKQNLIADVGAIQTGVCNAFWSLQETEWCCA